MVYSASSRSSRMASITNQSQGGGSKKAGLVPIAKSASVMVAYQVRHLPQPMSFMMLPLSSTVGRSRGIGMRFN